MVALSWPILREFGKKHPHAERVLLDWFHAVRAENWSSLADVRLFANSVDYVGNHRLVFNIRGNHYRLVAAVVFSTRTVYLKFIGTHKESDLIDASQVEYHKN